MLMKLIALLLFLIIPAATAFAETAGENSTEPKAIDSPPTTTTDLDGCCTLRGDATGDGFINMGDFLYLTSYAFQGGPAPACLEHADANADLVVNVQDFLIVLRYAFGAGSPPAPC